VTLAGLPLEEEVVTYQMVILVLAPQVLVEELLVAPPAKELQPQPQHILVVVLVEVLVHMVILVLVEVVLF